MNFKDESMEKIKLFTVGFTKKNAEKFFDILKASGVIRIIDIRLRNVSQLAGFAKRDDLRYFLKTICDIDYIHKLELAPNKTILDEYKRNKGNWKIYEKEFIKLMGQRKVEEYLTRELINQSCLLCSEDKPDQCHRRLVAEYLNDKLGNIEIIHLL
jgi:uncharacterized protein (DUF488 family)